MKKKTVLISGGAGLIGSHLCEKLLNKKKYNYMYRQFVYRLKK